MSDDGQSRDELAALVRGLRGRVAALERELATQTHQGMATRLRDSEERFRQVTDTIDEVFWMTDPRKNSMLFISPAYERIWGRSCQSLIEQPMSFVESIHPRDRDAVISAFRRQTEATYDIEYRIVRTDGGITWIHDREFPIRYAAGDICRVVCVARDLTVEKDGLDPFPTRRSSDLEVFWMTDPRKNSMLFISPAYERIWVRSCQSLIEQPMSFI